LIFGLEPMHFVALSRLIAAVLVAALLTVLAGPGRHLRRYATIFS
jgi:ABC-type transporter Mla maintaining outer membrane lipid asymmetry permease subunit MlaE